MDDLRDFGLWFSFRQNIHTNYSFGNFYIWGVFPYLYWYAFFGQFWWKFAWKIYIEIPLSMKNHEYDAYLLILLFIRLNWKNGKLLWMPKAKRIQSFKTYPKSWLTARLTFSVSVDFNLEIMFSKFSDLNPIPI